MFICLYLCIFHAAYVKMSANWCKCMLHCTLMLPPTRRVTLNSVQQT